MRIYIWGTGVIANEINLDYKKVLDKLDIIGYIDNNVQMQGKSYFGKLVYSPDILKKDKNSYVIIANRFVKEILQQIQKDYPWYKNYIENYLSFFKKLQLITRYEYNADEEIKQIVDYLNQYPLQEFPYLFTQKYKERKVDINFDNEKSLFYVMHEDKKMYFSRMYKDIEEVLKYYNFICMEQDIDSPHRYLTEEFTISDNAIVIDAGVAEGNFALSIIDYVKKIYLFEPDKDWVEALTYTFEPYKEKVIIIDKCISDYIGKDVTTIDKELKGECIDFLKMDVEGEEYYALKGAVNTIKASEHMQCVICTYHQEFAYEMIIGLLKENHFSFECSKGYMWYPSQFDIIRPAVLRRGVVRGKK